jgi:ribonuclease HI
MILTTRAKYKKFATQAEAQAFIGASASAPSKSASASAPSQAKPSEGDLDDFMLASATTPMTLALPASLPPHLAELAKNGFAFTTAPHHLIVYTDGSALGNGRTGARAGLGVYYGYGGKAASSNISERVPGDVQTNNRGELLVSFHQPSS